MHGKVVRVINRCLAVTAVESWAAWTQATTPGHGPPSDDRATTLVLERLSPEITREQKVQ